MFSDPWIYTNTNAKLTANKLAHKYIIISVTAPVILSPITNSISSVSWIDPIPPYDSYGNGYGASAMAITLSVFVPIGNFMFCPLTNTLYGSPFKL